MKITFSFSECTFLRYYVPLIQEAKKRGHNIAFWIGDSRKYNSPTLPENQKEIRNLIDEYDVSNFIEDSDVCISCEGIMMQTGIVNYTLTILLDWITLYPKYINDVDYVVFPSRWFTTEMVDKAFKENKENPNSWCSNIQKTIDCGIKNNPKNLFLGSPKYDIILDRRTICSKYNLDPTFKYELVMYPRSSQREQTKIDETCKKIVERGNIPILKSRKKDPFHEKDIKKYICFYDSSWFPPTSLELMFISENVISTDSASVKEAVMLEKPVENIESKNYRMLEELYEKNAKEKYLWNYNSSQKILDHIEKTIYNK